jgi:hypothetical protein
MTPIHVLISLHRGYGLGDAVQMSAVLRHVAHFRPNWEIDYQAEKGRECVGRGIVARTFAYGEPFPSGPPPFYDAEVLICLYDTWANWGDRPNTRVSSCLREVFGLEWNREYARYQVNISQSIRNWAVDVVPSKSVAFHYQGDSDKPRKDLTDIQATQICDYVRSLGWNPYVLGRHIPKGYDAEVNCAIIEQCDAFVGIDSGPSKCASATDTPSLVIWTGHHPAPFHDPAPNTTHLVPVGYHGLEPVCNDPGVISWFEENYAVRQYESDPVEEVKQWLVEVLK